MFDTNDHPVHKLRPRLGDRAAHKLTRFCGSWMFIGSIFIYIIVWASLNVYGFVMQWDPYPFILLNLTLSCLAAIQGPIILMGQNLEANRDRKRAEYDYAVNRKAEKEISELKQDVTALKKIEKQLENVVEHVEHIRKHIDRKKKGL